ncbi:MAG: DUF3667 domain-containing protein [Chitinophagaceae bacterium]|nr:DUF3667 domain-containing protein [Chitinophagaceae bacterium]
MSRLRRRPEKNCLNCGAEVLGRYCQRCGQENVDTRESVWDLVSHFFKDITHFDGKFFSTIKYLFTKPGFLSTEYMIGRRASYVNPVRMYIFTSAFFFLIFFSLIKVDKESILKTAKVKMNDKTFDEIVALDSLAFDAFTRNINMVDKKDSLPMSRKEFKRYFDSMAPKGFISFTNSNYHSKEEYDSLLKTGAVKDGWIKRKMVNKQLDLNEKYGNEGGTFVKDYVNILLHSLPQMLFVLLPFFALILKLLYIRRKEYYYVNHGIFSIHFYIFSFIVMLFIFGLNMVNAQLNWAGSGYIESIMVVGILFYLYKAMRKFYGQRRAKTILKFLIFCFMIFFVLLLLSLFFVFYSLFKL